MVRAGSILFALLVTPLLATPAVAAAAAQPTPDPLLLDLVVQTAGAAGSPTAGGTNGYEASWSEIVAIALGVLGLTIGSVALWRGRRHDRLADMASTDGLTGLRNRRAFDLDLEAHAVRGEQPTAMLMIDVDHFKSFNDTHGHTAGDEVLRAVGMLLERHIRRGDVPYRYGGEEFCVLLPQTDLPAAMVAAERIRRAVEVAKLPLAATITASVGVAAGTATEIATVADRADGALYRAKHGGRNRVATA